MFLSDSELEAEAASMHSEADSGSLPETEGHASFSDKSFTTAFLQFVLGSLAEDRGPRWGFSYWDPEVLWFISDWFLLLCTSPLFCGCWCVKALPSDWLFNTLTADPRFAAMTGKC